MTIEASRVQKAQESYVKDSAQVYEKGSHNKRFDPSLSTDTKDNLANTISIILGLGPVADVQFAATRSLEAAQQFTLGKIDQETLSRMNEGNVEQQKLELAIVQKLRTEGKSVKAATSETNEQIAELNAAALDDEAEIEAASVEKTEDEVNKPKPDRLERKIALFVENQLSQITDEDQKKIVSKELLEYFARRAKAQAEQTKTQEPQATGFGKFFSSKLGATASANPSDKDHPSQFPKLNDETPKPSNSGGGGGSGGPQR